MCHLDGRLIRIKRVDDAESSISTVGHGSEGQRICESTGPRGTLRGGKGVQL